MSDATWSKFEAAMNAFLESKEREGLKQLVTHVLQFFEFVRDCSTAPEGSPGYWRTSYCFSWPAIEVEVFDDRLEVYRFREGPLDIRHVPHAPNSRLPVALAAEIAQSVANPLSTVDQELSHLADQAFKSLADLSWRDFADSIRDAEARGRSAGESDTFWTDDGRAYEVSESFCWAADPGGDVRLILEAYWASREGGKFRRTQTIKRPRQT